MGVGGDLRRGKGGELGADRLQGLVQAAGLQGGAASRRVQQLDDAGLGGLGGAGRQAGDQRREALGGDAGVGGTEDLALVHGQAALELAQVFVGQELGRQGLGLAEAFLGGQRAGPMGGLAQGLGIGCGPGEAVGDVLLGVQGGAVEVAVRTHPRGHRVLQFGGQHLGLAAGAVQ